MKLLSVIFPFRNEEENINELIKRVTTVLHKLNNWSYELIFVNDFSNDDSEKILIELQKKYPITIVNLSRKFGIGSGILAIIFSLVLIVYVLYEKFYGDPVLGTPGILIAISFFSGIILSTMGIIGVYIARIYEQIQGRPRYIIKDILKPK